MSLEEKTIANTIRKEIINIGYNCGSEGLHFGGTLSLVEIMIALYKNVLKYDRNNPYWENRDRLVLSKGHGILAQYLVMKYVGLVTDMQLLNFKKDFSKFAAHPSRHPEIGFEYAGGSLGQGLPLGFGIAMALKMKKNTASKVFVILGDGECDEGSIWEAAAAASSYNTNNLIAIIDQNGCQYDGPTEKVLNMKSLKEKFKSFGWDTAETNGHDVGNLTQILEEPHDLPLALIADTVKGKGISFMENEPIWHHSALTKEQFEIAMNELSGGQE